MNSKLTLLCLSLSAVLLSACSQKYISKENVNVTTEQARDALTIAAMPAPAPTVLSKSVRIAPLYLGYSNQMAGASDAANLTSNTEKYQKSIKNPVHRVVDQAVSTFSIDVDTGSYSNVRRYLQRENHLPPQDAVRIEEMLNYFDYAYAQPKADQPFALHTEVVDSPWKAQAKIIKIGIQAKDIAAKTLPAANLVFLIDVSGSMSDPDKLPLVKTTLKLLTEQLRPQDRVTLITYADGEKVILPATSGKDKQKIIKAIDQLEAGGATAGEAAIRMAYDAAQKSFVKDGINRILLATDGDFNVGVSNFETLKGMVAEKRKAGVSLTTLGFGTGNYNELMMEQLADAGDGNYSYIDSAKEAKKVLQRQLSSTLATVAQDVKIQVEFNPKTVKEYRLIGYENRLLNQEDFNNDKVDAGDIGAGHRVTALYEIVPVGQQGWLDDSRYQAQPAASATADKEYAFLKLRYKKPGQDESQLIEQAIAKNSVTLSAASTDTRFAIAIAAFAQQLKGGEYNAAMQWNDILKLAQGAAQPDPHELRAEFIDLIKLAQKYSVDQKKPLNAK